MYDNQMKNKERPEVSPRVPSRSSANVNKSPVMTSLDDLSLMFGGKFFKFINFYYSEVVLWLTNHLFFVLQKVPRHLNSRRLKGKLKKDEKQD